MPISDLARIFTRLLLALAVFPLQSQQVEKKNNLPDTSTFHWYTRETPLAFDTSAKPTNIRTTTLFGDFECDSSGAVYIRQDTPGDQLKEPVVRIKASDQPVTFNVPQSEFQDLDYYVFAFAVETGGSVLELAQVPRDKDGKSSTYLLTFDKDGQFRHKTRLSTSFRPVSLVALAGGNILATGTVEGANPKDLKSITAIFNTDGELVRQLQSSPGLPPNPKQLNPERVRLGDDQNILVLREGEPTRVDVYSQTGNLIRSLKLHPPFEHAQAYEVYGSGYRIIVQYGRVTAQGETPDGRTFFAVYQGETGELLNAYTQVSRGIVACIRNGEATVLVPGSDKHFGILTASLP
jgi:hypothetical protein